MRVDGAGERRTDAEEVDAVQRDALGAVTVATAVVGLLLFSVVIGPGSSAEAPVSAPAPVVDAPPVEAPADPEPSEPTEPPATVAPPLPLALRIDTIGVDAPLVSVGLEPDGAMEIPDDVREIGWYDPDDLGVRPGTTGTAVFASHVDSRTQGRGVLFELRQMRVGDTLDIDLEDGTTQTWVVTEVAQIPKVSMPLNEIFTWSGPPRVVVITCGGEFDRSARSYVDNIVVYAEPLDRMPDRNEGAPSV